MTTAVTMLEPFDTPMLDYHTDDIEMDPAHDHQMDQDLDSDSHFPEKMAEHDNVEIDMDTYPHDQEYDMFDPDAQYEEEMLDVELAEPQSAFPAPPAMDFPLYSLAPLPVTPLQPLSGIAELVAPASASELISEPATVAQSLSELPVAEPEPEAHEEVGAAPEGVADVPVEQHPSVDEHFEPDAHTVEPVPEAVVDESEHRTEAAETEAPVDDAAEAAYNETFEAEVEAEANIAENDEYAESADPLELSGGVYIDPPPGIILSFPDANHPDACLFNQPRLASSSLLEHSELTVMLQDKPTLYYATLSSVFEALRQDERFAAMADLSESELVLDAFDLQLVVSEDNIYARDVSLHELHLLHEGSGSSGPLRLKLHTVVPRFILRYRHLQDEVNRLQQVAEEYEEAEDQEPTNEQETNGQENYAQENEQEQVEQAETGGTGYEQDPANVEEEEDGQAQQEAPVEEQAEYDDYSRETGDFDYEHDAAETVETAEAADPPVEGASGEEHDVFEAVPETAADSTGLDVEAEREAFPEEATVGPDQTGDEKAVTEQASPQVTETALPLTDLASLDLPPPPEDDDDFDDDEVDDLGKDQEPTLDELTEADHDTEAIDSHELYPEVAEPANGEEQEHYELGTEYAEEHQDRQEQDADGDHVSSLEEYEDDWLEDVEENTQAHEGDASQWEEADHDTTSNQSSITLASKSSKRSYDELDQGLFDYEDTNAPPGSPDSKRARVEVAA